MPEVPETGRRLDHLLLQTEDLDRAEAFYLGFLGFTVKKREIFRDGRSLIVTDQGLGLTSGRPPGTGPVEHIAFRATGIEVLARRGRGIGRTRRDGTDGDRVRPVPLPRGS